MEIEEWSSEVGEIMNKGRHRYFSVALHKAHSFKINAIFILKFQLVKLRRYKNVVRRYSVPIYVINTTLVSKNIIDFEDSCV